MGVKPRGGGAVSLAASNGESVGKSSEAREGRPRGSESGDSELSPVNPKTLPAVRGRRGSSQDCGVTLKAYGRMVVALLACLGRDTLFLSN